MPDTDAPVFGQSMSQISRHVYNMAKAAGLGNGYSSHSGCARLAIRMIRRGAPLHAVQTHGRWKSPQMPARYTRVEKALEWLYMLTVSVRGCVHTLPCAVHGVHQPTNDLPQS